MNAYDHFFDGSMVKNLPAMQETQVRSPGQEESWRREWQPTPVFLPGEFHGQGNLAGLGLGLGLVHGVIKNGT